MRVCQSKVTHVPLVTWVDLRWVTVEFSRVLAQFVCLNISGLRQKEKISIQLQPWQKSGGKRQKARVQIEWWQFKIKYNVKLASLIRDETSRLCQAETFYFLNHQENNNIFVKFDLAFLFLFCFSTVFHVSNCNTVSIYSNALTSLSIWEALPFYRHRQTNSGPSSLSSWVVCGHICSESTGFSGNVEVSFFFFFTFCSRCVEIQPGWLQSSQ